MENVKIGNQSYNDVSMIKLPVQNSENYAFFRHVATRDKILVFDKGTITATDGGTVEIVNDNAVRITNKSSSGPYVVNVSNFANNAPELTTANAANQPKIMTFHSGDVLHAEVVGTSPLNLSNKTITLNIIQAESTFGTNLFTASHLTSPDDYTKIFDRVMDSSFDVGAIFTYMQTQATGDILLTFKLFVNGMQWI